jgi:hypothetical protein
MQRMQMKKRAPRAIISDAFRKILDEQHQGRPVILCGVSLPPSANGPAAHKEFWEFCNRNRTVVKPKPWMRVGMVVRVNLEMFVDTWKQYNKFRDMVGLGVEQPMWLERSC